MKKLICESCGNEIENLRGPSYLKGESLCQYCFIRKKYKNMHPLKLEKLLHKISERIERKKKFKQRKV